MHEALAELTRFARYERRAWSSQKKAMRNFSNIKFRLAPCATSKGSNISRQPEGEIWQNEPPQ
jgi:hypothetical protein